mmetsp:Transcript_10489/g.17250  ORF Transcript_10489/g.17250 Transcript_10489/m.17250 type:complete len:249 (-) Transcript_10489:115-861(-)
MTSSLVSIFLFFWFSLPASEELLLAESAKVVEDVEVAVDVVVAVLLSTLEPAAPVVRASGPAKRAAGVAVRAEDKAAGMCVSKPGPSAIVTSRSVSMGLRRKAVKKVSTLSSLWSLGTSWCPIRQHFCTVTSLLVTATSERPSGGGRCNTTDLPSARLKSAKSSKKYVAAVEEGTSSSLARISIIMDELEFLSTNTSWWSGTGRYWLMSSKEPGSKQVMAPPNNSVTLKPLSLPVVLVLSKSDIAIRA